MNNERKIKNWLKSKKIKIPHKLTDEMLEILQKLYYLEETEKELTKFFQDKYFCK
jgi:hypothetical protein